MLPQICLCFFGLCWPQAGGGPPMVSELNRTDAGAGHLQSGFCQYFTSQIQSLLNLKQTNLPNHLQIHHNYLQLDLFNLIQMDMNGRQINSKDRFTGLQVLLIIGVFGNHNSTNYFFSFDILHSYGQTCAKPILIWQ